MVPTVRDARVDDAPAVAAFQARAWEQTYRGVVPDAFLDAADGDDRVGRWTTRLTTGARRVLVAVDEGGELVGVASTARTDPAARDPAADDLPPLELCTLYVDAGAHGTGLGVRLLDAALGREDAHLLVFTANGRARRFYGKHGFRPVGEARRDPGTGLDEERWVRRRAQPEVTTG